MVTDERTVTAFHEAGHVVLGWMVGIGVESVMIHPTAHSEGRTLYLYPPQFEYDVMNDKPAALKAMALAGSGGMAADLMHHRRTGRTDRYVSGDGADQENVRDLIHRAGYRSPSDFEAFVMTAAQMLNDERIWPIVREVADQLLVKRTLSESDLVRFRDAVPQVNDVLWQHLEKMVDFKRGEADQPG